MANELLLIVEEDDEEKNLPNYLRMNMVCIP